MSIEDLSSSILSSNNEKCLNEKRNDFIDIDIRYEIWNALGIKSVYPCSLLKDNDNTLNARCILEHTPGIESSDAVSATRYFDKLYEDVIVRYKDSRLFYQNQSTSTTLAQTVKDLIAQLYRPNSVEYNSASSPSSNISYYLQTRLKSNSLHPGINSVFLSSFIQDDTSEKVVICQEFNKHTALSLSRFHAKTTLTSPTLARCGGLGAKDLRLRFTVYQLFQVLSFLHSRKIIFNELNPSGIMLDDDLWLTLPFSISDRTCMSAHPQLSEHMISSRAVSIPRSIDDDVPITIQWVDGKISNFEYLMAINHAAGRTMIDPLYHPILPWVTDFTAEYDESDYDITNDGIPKGMRDLSKTKFRLSKGDPQLQTTYRHSDPPHHVPESLSELTYYIYLARRTPLQVLRRVVRDVFVPEHYPSSVARMYDWTPDECIPEFYIDASVFSSIHKDLNLPDLDLPSFISSANDFIRYHRQVFESDYVSQKLHHWIDLTFGYCLEGIQAVNHMNVPLRHTLTATERLGDIQSLEKHPGFCILFKQPHPQKKIRSYDIQGCDQTTSHHSTIRNDLVSFLNLEYRSSNSKSRRKYEKKINSFESAAPSSSSTSSFNNPFSSIANSINSTTVSNRPANHQSRPLSLSAAYDSQASWLALELAEDVDVRQDKSSSYMQKLRDDYHYNLSFAESYRPVLCPSYKLPMTVVDNDMTPSKSILPSTILDTNNTPWDSEFAESTYDLNRTLSPAPSLTFLDKCIGDDMFAVGCIIAELYIGRPLLSHKDNLLIKLSQNQPHGERISTAHVMKIIYSINAIEVPEPLHPIKSASSKSPTSPGREEDEADITAGASLDNHIASIPLQICRLLTLLLQPNPTLRPSASEVLQACTGHDIDMWSKKDVASLRAGGSKPGYVHFSTILSSKPHDEILPPSHLLDLMDIYCSSIFPSYFRSIFAFIGSLKLAGDSLTKFRILVDFLSDLHVIVLEGISLALPHILEVIGDASPFKQYTSALSIDLQHYASIIDVIGLRLSNDATEKLVLPKVAEFLNGLNSPSALQQLLSTPMLWHTLIIRGGARSFLRYFLPLLLTYLSSGTLQSISFGYNTSTGASSPSDRGVSPLWATMGITDKTEWLHLCKKSDLKAIQEVAVLVISSLVDAAGLGPGLTARFVLPPLMSLIGSPQFSVAGYNIHEQQSVDLAQQWNDLRDDTLAELKSSALSSPTIKSKAKLIEAAEAKLENFLSLYALQSSQDTYTVHAIVALCSHLGELITSELVLRRICDEILPSLEPLFNIPIPAQSTVSALMEIILLLNGILPNLSQDVICNYYLKSRPNSFSLPELLTTISLYNMWSIGDDLASGSQICDIEIYLQSDRRYSLILELVRLIVSSSMIVGSSAAIEHVLPAVDKFFGNFVDVFGKLPIHSKVLLRAFELGAELYLPLENFTSGAFSATVPNLNPKLEIWLVSIGSGSETRTSPPLPNNILPEVIVDHSTHEGKKKKGMFSGMFSSSSSSTSVSSSSGKLSTSYSSSISSMIYTSKAPPTPSVPKPKDMPDDIPWTKTPHAHRTSLAQRPSFVEPETKATSHDTDSDGGQDELDYSPVALAALTAPRSAYTIRTPFSKLEGKVVEDAGTGNSHHSTTEGMELKAIEKTSHPIQSPLTGRSLNFNLVDTSSNVTKQSRSPDSDDDDMVITSSTFKKDDDDDGYLSAKESIDGNGIDAIIVDTIQREVSDSSPESPTKRDEDITPVVMSSSPPTPSIIPAHPSKPIINPSKFLHELLAGNARPRAHSSNTNGSNRQRGSSISKTRKRDIIHQVVRGNATRRGSEADVETEEDMKDMYHSEIAWMLAGYGRWGASHTSSTSHDSHHHSHNSSSISSMTSTTTSSSSVSSSIKARASRIATAAAAQFSHSHHVSANTPSAQISMTSPRIAVDAASEAGSLFSLSMTVHAQVRDDESTNPHPTSSSSSSTSSSSNTTSNAAIRCLTVNATESLLISTSRSGTKLWSLNTFPITQVAKYHNSGDSIPFAATFLRTGSHIATCDGSINIWDIETSRVVSYIGHSPLQSPFYSMSCTTSRYGVAPGIQPMGDDQILTSSNHFTLNHYDYRSPSRMNNLKAISEWQLPSLPFLPSSQMTAFSSSAQAIEALTNNHITCAMTHEQYALAGSNNGGLWILDRRTGRSLAAWQGHDSCVVKIAALDDHHFLSIAERSAFVWSYSSSTPIKIYTIKNMPDSASTPLTANTTIITSFESALGINHSYLSNDMRLSQQQHVLYGIAGHKMYGGKIRNTFDSVAMNTNSFWSATGSPIGINHRERPCYSMGLYREAVDMEEMKLTQTYFMDRNRAKIVRSKLTTTSAALLPLRRLLLLGAEDGTIRVVS